MNSCIIVGMNIIVTKCYHHYYQMRVKCMQKVDPVVTCVHIIWQIWIPHMVIRFHLVFKGKKELTLWDFNEIIDT